MALFVAFVAVAVHPMAVLAEEVGTVSIVHTNDSHGGYGFTSESGTPVGYYAAVAGLADSVDADLVLDAGDTFHGDSFATITNGESIARLMKAAGYDATTPGNHDWSYGSAQLLVLSEQVPGCWCFPSRVPCSRPTCWMRTASRTSSPPTS